MADVVSEKVIEIVEEKKEEIKERVKSEADKELDKVEEKVQDLLDTINGHLKEVEAAKDVAPPAVKKVIDLVEEGIIEEVDGRVFSCFCLGWNLALRISRKKTPSSPTKPLASAPPSTETRSVELPPSVETSA